MLKMWINSFCLGPNIINNLISAYTSGSINITQQDFHEMRSSFIVFWKAAHKHNKLTESLSDTLATYRMIEMRKKKLNKDNGIDEEYEAFYGVWI
jgi:hypothetical protein